MFLISVEEVLGGGRNWNNGGRSERNVTREDYKAGVGCRRELSRSTPSTDAEAGSLTFAVFHPISKNVEQFDKMRAFKSLASD